jgi:hypothetical protein
MFNQWEEVTLIAATEQHGRAGITCVYDSDALLFWVHMAAGRFSCCADRVSPTAVVVAAAGDAASCQQQQQQQQ